MWGQLQAVPADVDYQALAEEFAPQGAAAPPAAPAAAPAPSPAPPSSRTVLPAERCAVVGAVLAALSLSPAAARDALLHLLEPERSAAGPLLGEEQAAQLLECLPRCARGVESGGGSPAASLRHEPACYASEVCCNCIL